MGRAGVDEAVLFGSRARGDHLLTSDVDLIAISARFAGTRPHRRLADLHDHWDPELPFLQVLAYTPDEFSKACKGPGIERIADRTGIRITIDDDGGEDA